MTSAITAPLLSSRPLPPWAHTSAGLVLCITTPALRPRHIHEQARRSLQQALAVSPVPQSGGDDMAAAPEADTPANLDLDTRVCQVRDLLRSGSCAGPHVVTASQSKLASSWHQERDEWCHWCPLAVAYTKLVLAACCPSSM